MSYSSNNMALAPAYERRTWLDLLVPFLVTAYLTMSRSFAHWGVPPIYVGEIALGAVLLAKPQALIGPFLQGCIGRSLYSYISFWLYISLAYGVLQTTRGILCDYNAKIAIQNLAFNVYPLFFFVGAWVGGRDPQALRRVIRILAWVHGIYGVAYVCALSPMGLGDNKGDDPSMQNDFVGMFGQPYGAAVVLLGLLCFEPRLIRVWLPMVLNAFVLIAMMVRSAWFSFAFCLPLWAWLSGRMGQLFKMTMLLIALLLVGLVADIEIPGPADREETITTRNVIGRAVAAFSPELASYFTDHIEFYAGTVEWRKLWWTSIAENVHQRPDWTLIGPGYGYPIWHLYPVEMFDGELRTPHNVFVYCLGYTGWVGVGIFVALQISIIRVLWKAYRNTGQVFGLCYVMMILFWASFDNFFEAPFGAIPYYLLVGLAAAAARAPQQAGREEVESGQ